MNMLIDAFTKKGKKDMGEGDYKDFIWQYMNALNHGAQDEDLQYMSDEIPQERQDEMLKFGGGPNLERNPHIRAARSNVNRMLKR